MHHRPHAAHAKLALFSTRTSTGGSEAGSGSGFIDVTLVKDKPSSFKIDHSRPLLFVGSCFSENISNVLGRRNFRVLKNPYGVLFSPLSIAKMLENAVNKRSFTANDIVQASSTSGRDQIYFSYDCHTQFTSLTESSVIDQLNSAVSEAHSILSTSSTLFITLGSSKVHYLKASGMHVANCHKQPSSLFDSRYLTVGETVEALSKAIAACTTLNPLLKVVLTVSPVRHTREGLVENTRR